VTNPLTAFAFAVTGAPALRTLPDRLLDSGVHNVMDFGARGIGDTHDDLPAILAAMDWQVANNYRGTLYFPPAPDYYYVSAPIDFSALYVAGPPSQQFTGLFVSWLGEMGRSIIVGDFADYVLRRGMNEAGRYPGPWSIDKLKIINRHADGGGIRLGATQASAIRDCDITADIAINENNTEEPIDDVGTGPNLDGSFEVLIENCNLRPYNTRRAGSIGIYKLSDGPVTNCRIIGFESGMRTGSGQGGASVQGTYFEGNTYGFRPGYTIESWGRGGGSVYTLEGCHFKDNGIAIYGYSTGIYRGVYIEATTGSIPGDPQYGMLFEVGKTGGSFKGISVVGDFQQYGISLAGGETIRTNGAYAGVSSLNSVSSPTKNWHLPVTAMSARFTAINKAAVFTVAQLPAFTLPVTNMTWAAGIVTVTFNPVIDVSLFATMGVLVNVTGMTPSGYNGQHSGGTVLQYNQLSFALASDPGPATVMGSVFFTIDYLGTRDAYEGETYDVSDCVTSTWGAAAVGGGSTHAKVRFTPAAWTVMGI
jgi:hypothetical protein